MSITTVTAIIKDCCEAEPSDPDHPDTICISVSDLEIIVARNLEVVILSDDPLPHNAALSARADARPEEASEYSEAAELLRDALEDAQREPGQEDHDAMRTLADWHEDDGPVVWWRLPVDEPAWIGTPLDEDWPGYHTHWTPHPAAPKETEPREQGRARLTADVVEQRLLTWRQRFVNRSGDQLALDDFMDRQSIDDLVDFVCDEDTPPGVLDALHERVQDDHDAVRFMRAVVDKGHRYVLIVEPRDGGSRMQMDSGMRRIEIERMLERFARGAREDARLGGDE